MQLDKYRCLLGVVCDGSVLTVHVIRTRWKITTCILTFFVFLYTNRAMGIWVTSEKERMMHSVGFFFFHISPSVFCKPLKRGLARRQSWHVTVLAFFYFSVSGSWIMTFLRHCAGVVDEKEKEMSNYLPVYLLFLFHFFLTLLQTPPKHLLNITTLVYPSGFVFWRSALILCQVPTSEQIRCELPDLAFKVITSLLITVIPS